MNPNDDILLLGDFNMSGISWKYTEEDNGYLTAHSNILYYYIAGHESKFVKMCAAFGIFQINHLPNEEGKFLDLVFTSNVTNITIDRTMVQGT